MPMKFFLRRLPTAALSIVFIAAVLTFACGSAIRYERFALFDAAVVASAIYAGAPGGLFSTIAGILIVDYRWLPPRGSIEFGDPPTLFAVLVFTLVSLVVTGLAVQFPHWGTCGIGSNHAWRPEFAP